MCFTNGKEYADEPGKTFVDTCKKQYLKAK